MKSTLPTSVSGSTSKIKACDEVQIGKWYLLNKIKIDGFYMQENGVGVEVLNEDRKVLVCADTFESNLVVFKSNTTHYRVLNERLVDVIDIIDQVAAVELLNGVLLEKQDAIKRCQSDMQAVINNINMSGCAESNSREIALVTKDALLLQSKKIKEVHAGEIEGLNLEIKGHVSKIHSITQYYTLPALTEMSRLDQGKKFIDKKLSELSLYGGLNELVTDIAVGAVSSESQPIYLHQGLRYMDAECVIGYRYGGLEVGSISKFNEWLAKPENRDRVLPHERSIVAIKTTMNRTFSMGNWHRPPQTTFIYLRNGENIRSVQTDLEVVGSLLATEDELAGGFYVRKVAHYKDNNKNFSFLPRNEYENLVKVSQSSRAAYLDAMLTSYKLAIDYNLQLLSYAQHKNSIIGDGKLSAFNQSIVLNKSKTGRYRPCTQADFDKAVAKQEICIAELEKNKLTIMECIKNNLSDPKLSFPSSYYSCLFNVLVGEVGFLGLEGEVHEMPYPRNDYLEALTDARKKYTDIGLYIPNQSEEVFGKTQDNPYSIATALNKYGIVDASNYFFDELREQGWRRYQRQNDLAILIQGILDRTSFFGHVRINLFKESFEEKVVLVHDVDKGIYESDTPDYAKFITKCNEESKSGDIFVGQAQLWDIKQQEKKEENSRYNTIPMPKFLSAEKITRKKDGRVMVRFRWETIRSHVSKSKNQRANNVFEVDIKELLNVTSYNRGDCERFSKDSRCLRQYDKWGHLIMRAERYHQKINATKS